MTGEICISWPQARPFADPKIAPSRGAPWGGGGGGTVGPDGPLAGRLDAYRRSSGAGGSAGGGQQQRCCCGFKMDSMSLAPPNSSTCSSGAENCARASVSAEHQYRLRLRRGRSSKSPAAKTIEAANDPAAGRLATPSHRHSPRAWRSHLEFISRPADYWPLVCQPDNAFIAFGRRHEARGARPASSGSPGGM